jgi:peptidoglycan/LPS O-acetylase OafA/YrhL
MRPLAVALHSPQAGDYRPDIDGLRAIAVLCVVAFHAFPELMRGGFIGVDIFFVISGYLISKLIFSSLEKGTFSIVDFYNRRIRRIFPSLITVMVASLAFGWIALLPDEYLKLGKHLVAGSAFISNFVLWGESGYFDDSVETKPMLHLWSLAIEEQFYVFWPLLLILVSRNSLSFLKTAGVIAVLSFTANIYLTGSHPVAAFYSPISRFWELMVGAVLAYLVLYRPTFFQAPGSWRSIAGLAFLVVGLAGIDKGASFPGWISLLPTLGTFFLISGGNQAWFNRKVLGSRPLVAVGLISYALYLWHWVSLSFLRILSPNAGAGPMLAAVLLAFVLAWLTYAYIERPIRNGGRGLSRSVALVASMSAVFVAGVFLYRNEGLPNREVARINHDRNSAFAGGMGRNVVYGCSGLRNEEVERDAYCVRDSRGPIRYALIGDSKAGALLPGLLRASNNNGRWLSVGGTAANAAPVPILSDKAIYKRYQHLASGTLDALANDRGIEVVVVAIAARTLFNLHTDYTLKDLPASPYYEIAYEGLLRGVKALVAAGKKVVLVMDHPTLPYPEHCLERITSSELVNEMLDLREANKPCAIVIEDHYALAAQYRKLIHAVGAADPGNVFVFDTMPYLCDMENGVCRSFKDNRLLYGVTDHVSDYASGLIGPALNNLVASVGK